MKKILCFLIGGVALFFIVLFSNYNVFIYLKNTESLYSKAFNTQSYSHESDFQEDNIIRDLFVVKDSLERVTQLPYPQACGEYRKLVIKILELVELKHHLIQKEGKSYFDHVGVNGFGIEIIKYEVQRNILKQQLLGVRGRLLSLVMPWD